MDPTTELGPVEMVLLTFPGEQVDAAVVAAVAEVVRRGDVTILDLLVIVQDGDREVRVTDFDDDLSTAGLDALPVRGQPLVSDEDVEFIRSCLDPGDCAVVLVYEESWARRVAGAVRAAGGEVTLHVQLPRETVEAALAAAPLN